MVRELIYVDNNATTRQDPRVTHAMLPFFSDYFGNAASTHIFGMEAEAAVERARQQVAALIGCRGDEIIFTSGATEANNLVIMWAFQKGLNITTSALEHKAILEPCSYATARGMHLTKVPISPFGNIELSQLRPGGHDLVTLMAANNEIHSLLDISEVGAICRQAGAYFHTDAAQAVGRIDLDVAQMGIDLLSLSGHKIYGPKGIGALYISRRLKPVFTPLLRGGGQEQNLRSGTLPVPLIVGLGEACHLAYMEAAKDREHVCQLTRRLLQRLDMEACGYELIGPQNLAQRQPGGLNLKLPGMNTRRLCEAIPEIAWSFGSACNSTTGSHVLKALNLDSQSQSEILRLSLGRFNRASEVDYLARRLAMYLKGQTFEEENSPPVVQSVVPSPRTAFMPKIVSKPWPTISNHSKTPNTAVAYV